MSKPRMVKCSQCTWNIDPEMPKAADLLEQHYYAAREGSEAEIDLHLDLFAYDDSAREAEALWELDAGEHTLQGKLLPYQYWLPDAPEFEEDDDDA